MEGNDCNLGNDADSFSSSVARRDSGGDIYPLFAPTTELAAEDGYE